MTDYLGKLAWFWPLVKRSYNKDVEDDQENKRKYMSKDGVSPDVINLIVQLKESYFLLVNC